MLGMGQLAKSIFQGFGKKVGIDAGFCFPERSLLQEEKIVTFFPVHFVLWLVTFSRSFD